MKSKFVTVNCSICEKDFKVKDFWVEIADGRKDFIEMQCPTHSDHSKILRQKETAKIPLEKKQKVLDLLKSGKKIGDIRKEVDLSLDVTCEIIMQNIEHYPMLRKEAI